MYTEETEVTLYNETLLHKRSMMVLVNTKYIMDKSQA